MEEQVKAELEKIRKYLQADGGDVEFVEMDGKTVKVRLTGACGGCPMAQMTLKMGIEASLKKTIPDLEAVEAV